MCIAHSILTNPWPFWPPRPTLLTCPNYLEGVDFSKQEQWGANEWRAYANYLEERGAALVNELAKKAAELEQARRKASRRGKPIKHRQGSLLTGIEEEPKGKRGPKKKENLPTLKYARLILQIQREHEAQGKKKSYVDILDEDIIKSLGGWREKAEIKCKRKTILNTVSKIGESR